MEFLRTSSAVEALPEAYDAHCHPDRARKSLGLSQAAGIREFLGAPLKGTVSFGQVSIVGGCAVYCDPSSWPKPGRVPQAPGWVVAVGGTQESQATG